MRLLHQPARKVVSAQPPIGVAADEFGEPFRQPIIEHITAFGLKTVDYSTKPRPDYPDLALSVASAIAAGIHKRGILVCGTGLGMAVVANKVHGIRAVTVHDIYSAERARKSLNAQILAMGAQVIEQRTALQIISKWLVTEYEGGRSAPKYARLLQIDDQLRS